MPREGGFQEGQEVRLQGLKATPEKNGMTGTLGTFYRDRERWSVILTDGSFVTIKPENLVLLKSESSGVQRLQGLTDFIKGEEIQKDTPAGSGMSAAMPREGGFQEG